MFAPKGTPDAAVTRAARGRTQGGRGRDSSCRPCRTSARTWPTSTSPSSGPSGRPMPGAWRRPCARSARCDAAVPTACSRRRRCERAQRPRRRRRLPRCRRGRAGGQRRPAVRHAGLARRRHAADAGRRADDGLRRSSCWCGRRQPAAGRGRTGTDLPHALRVVVVAAAAVALYTRARLPDHHAAAAVRADLHRRAAPVAAGAGVQHRRHRVSPTHCFALLLRTPLPRGLFGF